MDFYDSIFQYDLEVQNKLTERLNTFFKSINLLKNESLINHPNNTESKYKHIHYIINEINSSNKFRSKLLLNQKKQLLLRMNNKNKNKLNSKYYIYAKDMNKDNQTMDIIEIENSLNKKESNIDTIKQELKLEKCFNQKKIYYDEQRNEKDNITEEQKNLNKIQSDINKIVCDIIKQNVKKIYNQKLNEIPLNNNKDKNIENNNNNINNIKNNNYIKIDLPKKDIYFQEFKKGKDNIKIHNNHSTEKNANYINYFKDNKKNAIKKELRNSVANNNMNHLKIKVNKNDIIQKISVLNFNNLNNNNINNLLINKIKNLKHDNNNDVNNIQSNKLLENENTMKEKEKEKINCENEDNNYKNKKKMNNKDNCEKNNNDKNNNNDNKNGEQNHKKMIIRNIQRIQIKNIKLKNNPTGYNLTNICKKKLEDFENSDKNNLKKSKQKNRQCASPGDVGLNNKKINILKFKLGKNDPTSIRKNTEKNSKKKSDVEILNVNDNSLLSNINDKMKDIYSHGKRFSSVKKKKISDDMSINDLSQISDKQANNNFLIKNYKTNINRNNNNLNNKNSFTKESEYDNEKYLVINRNNNNIRKSLSKESGSNSYLPWKIDNPNAIVNKSNNKGNMIDSYLNHAFKIDKNNNNFDINLINIKEYKNRNKKSNNTNYIYKDNILKNKENNNKIYEQNYENNQMEMKNIKYKKNKSIYNANNNFKENKHLVDAGYNDTINNKDEPISHREGIKIKGKRRILSTRVHIRGVNSSKNFNNILGKNA